MAWHMSVAFLALIGGASHVCVCTEYSPPDAAHIFATVILPLVEHPASGTTRATASAIPTITVRLIQLLLCRRLRLPAPLEARDDPSPFGYAAEAAQVCIRTRYLIQRSPTVCQVT